MFPVLPLLQVKRGEILGPGAGGDARATVAALARASGGVVLVDLDGLASNRPDWELVRDVARRNEVWADVGSREAADVADALVAGASRVTARWSLLRGTSELEEAAEIAESGALYLGLEFREAFVANPRMPRMGADDALEAATRLQLPVVALDVGTPGPARRAVAGRFSGERWYAAPVTPAELAPLQAEGWAGGIGLPPGAPP